MLSSLARSRLHLWFSSTKQIFCCFFFVISFVSNCFCARPTTTTNKQEEKENRRRRREECRLAINQAGDFIQFQHSVRPSQSIFSLLLLSSFNQFLFLATHESVNWRFCILSAGRDPFAQHCRPRAKSLSSLVAGAIHQNTHKFSGNFHIFVNGRYRTSRHGTSIFPVGLNKTLCVCRFIKFNWGRPPEGGRGEAGEARMMVVVRGVACVPFCWDKPNVNQRCEFCVPVLQFQFFCVCGELKTEKLVETRYNWNRSGRRRRRRKSSQQKQQQQISSSSRKERERERDQSFANRNTTCSERHYSSVYLARDREGHPYEKLYRCYPECYMHVCVCIYETRRT